MIEDYKMRVWKCSRQFALIDSERERNRKQIDDENRMCLCDIEPYLDKKFIGRYEDVAMDLGLTVFELNYERHVIDQFDEFSDMYKLLRTGEIMLVDQTANGKINIKAIASKGTEFAVPLTCKN